MTNTWIRLVVQFVIVVCLGTIGTSFQLGGSVFLATILLAIGTVLILGYYQARESIDSQDPGIYFAASLIGFMYFVLDMLIVFCAISLIMILL